MRRIVAFCDFFLNDQNPHEDIDGYIARPGPGNNGARKSPTEIKLKIC